MDDLRGVEGDEGRGEDVRPGIELNGGTCTVPLDLLRGEDGVAERLKPPGEEGVPKEGADT